MGKRGKTNSSAAGLPRGRATYWQSKSLNQRYQQFFRNQLLQLALARFRWENLPETCDVRYLEMQLLCQGSATLALPGGDPTMTLSLQAACETINMYGNPATWRAIGDDGTNFSCDNSNAVFLWDNLLHMTVASAFTLLSYDMADIIRTKQVNRQHMKTPVIYVADQTYKQQLLNLLKQTAGNEPAVIGTRSLRDAIDVTALQSGVEFLGNELQEDLLSTWNMAFLFLGIENLPYKAERQTADEIRSYTEPTDLLKLNPLMCRRQACDKFNDRFGTLVWGREKPKQLAVYWNQDVETASWNAFHDASKLLDGGD